MQKNIHNILNALPADFKTAYLPCSYPEENLEINTNRKDWRIHAKMLPSLITYILYIFHNGKNMDSFHHKQSDLQ